MTRGRRERKKVDVIGVRDVASKSIRSPTFRHAYELSPPHHRTTMALINSSWKYAKYRNKDSFGAWRSSRHPKFRLLQTENFSVSRVPHTSIKFEPYESPSFWKSVRLPTTYSPVILLPAELAPTVSYKFLSVCRCKSQRYGKDLVRRIYCERGTWVMLLILVIPYWSLLLTPEPYKKEYLCSVTSVSYYKPAIQNWTLCVYFIPV